MKSTYKIACIGNTNHSLFCIARYLRDQGYDAHLLLLNEPDHFLPGADSYDEEYQSYTTQLDWETIGWWYLSRKKIKKDLKGYDFILGCGYTPAYLFKANIHLDIFVFVGGDLILWPFYKIKHFPPSKADIGNYLYARAQKKGIEDASYILMDYTSEEYEEVLHKFSFKGKRLKFPAPFIYLPQYNISLNNIKKSKYFSEFLSIRNNFDFMIFHHARHEWTNPDIEGYNYKANDKLLLGFADFLKQNKTVNVCLVLFEYGNDVQASKKYIQELGIEAHIKWFPKMQRRELVAGITLSDLGVGEFGYSWFSYGVIFECMAFGVPVMHFRNDSDYTGHYPEMYPMYNANSSKQITDVLNQLISKPEGFRETGKLAQEWFMKYAIDRPVNELIKAIEVKRKKNR
jgi:hypothetical protein